MLIIGVLEYEVSFGSSVGLVLVNVFLFFKGKLQSNSLLWSFPEDNDLFILSGLCFSLEPLFDLECSLIFSFSWLKSFVEVGVLKYSILLCSLSNLSLFLGELFNGFSLELGK